MPSRARVRTRFRHKVSQLLNSPGVPPNEEPDVPQDVEDQLADLPSAARKQAEQMLSEVGAWAGPLRTIVTAPDPAGVLVTIHFEDAVVAFVAPFGEPT